MPTEEQLQEGFELGDWQIIPSKGVMRQGSEEVRPEPLALRVLFSLAKRDGDLVTRDDLIADAWGGRPTADDPINRAIAQLRKLLGDTSKPPTYIETLHRRGYRLMKPVVLQSGSETSVAEATPPAANLKLRLWKTLATILALSFVAVAVGTWIATRVPVRSIAVLPFQNLSGEVSDEYLVLGFKEELVHALHGIKDITVKNGRVDYDMEPEEIAAALEVESVLSGSMRRSGSVLKINYTISKGSKGVVHSGDIEGSIDDLFSLQVALADKVRDDLIIGRSSKTLFKSRPTDSVAYDSYMRGVYALEHRGAVGNLEGAIALFQKSIELDQSYGPSYLGLATAYALMVDYRDAPLLEMNTLAIRTVEAGVVADPIISDAASAIYGFVYHKEKRWAESEQAYLRAVNGGIVDSNAFNWYSRMLASVGRLEDALEQALLAVEIDPSSAVVNNRVAIVSTWLQDSENAHTYFKRSFDLGSDGASQIHAYALLLAREGKLEKARALAHSGVQSAGTSSEWVGPLFDAFADRSLAPQAITALDAAANAQQLPPQVDLIARTMLGEIDSAMAVARQLQLPGERYEAELLFIPELRPLREHPEFMALLQDVGIVEYWQSSGCVWRDDRVVCTTDTN